MLNIEVDLASVDQNKVDLIVEAMAETIEGLAPLEPSTDEIIVAVGEVFQILVSIDGGAVH